MTFYTYPTPRAGIDLAQNEKSPDVAYPLAGSRYAWFDLVMTLRTDGVWEGACAYELSPGFRERLSRQRADLCGLTLDRPRVMGIVNVTPDSFSDGGDRFGVTQAVRAAQDMVASGADILDIGGESTRPGADVVPEAEEIARVVPVIEAIRDAGITAPISIDTRKALVADAALTAGASMVNDVSALSFDAQMGPLVAERNVPVCLMHALGDPKTMQDDPRYEDVTRDVYDYLLQRIEWAQSIGIRADNIIADPGIGFGKTLDHNLKLLQELAMFHSLSVPLLLGASRKRFIGTIGNAPQAKDRMPGSVAVALHAAAQGAHIVRVHDVKETVQALALWQAINDPKR